MKEYLIELRAEYVQESNNLQATIFRLQGAIAAVDQVIAKLDEPAPVEEAPAPDPAPDNVVPFGPPAPETPTT